MNGSDRSVGRKTVCILLSTYNGEEFLEQQIESILDQVGVKTEIIARDDGSTDGTQELLDKWQRKGCLKWYTGKNLGTGKSFWDLLEKAPVSDYYAFCDQDDAWDADKLSCAVEKIGNADNRYTLYCCGSRLVDKDGKFLMAHHMDCGRSQYARFFITGVAGNTMVFNKALRDRLIQYRPQCMGLHDTWVYKAALCLGAEIVMDSEPHLDYRQHENNVVGMELNLSDKIHKFFHVINDRSVCEEVMEIKSVFRDEMRIEYIELINTMEKSKSNIMVRIKMCVDNRLRFNNFFFDLAFKIKILTNKL